MDNRAYITKSGDTWDMISLAVYGSELFVSELIEANPDRANTLVFGAGIKLIIPEITQSQRENTSLPPWRR